jgi:hypothetical protein
MRSLLLAIVLASSPGLVRAQGIDLEYAADDEVQPVVLATLTVTSGVGTLVTGVAAIVYAVRGDALDTPWLVASLFSGALSAGTAISLMTLDEEVAPVLGGGLLLLSVWPLAYSVRSAISPGGFGEPLGAVESPPTRAVAASLAPPGARLSVPLWSWEF